jgi:hypothetical protein
VNLQFGPLAKLASFQRVSLVTEFAEERREDREFCCVLVLFWDFCEGKFCGGFGRSIWCVFWLSAGLILLFQDWGERLVGFREQIFYSVFFPSRLGVANSKLLLSAEKMGSEEKIRIADLESGLLDRVAGGSGDYYVGLAESPEAAVTNRERRALRIASTVFITICCFLAALYGAVSLYPRIEALVTKGAVPGTFSFNSPLSSVNLRGEEALQQQLHRTSYHYQPAKNWMNVGLLLA